MKEAKEYLREACIGDCVIFERNKISVWLIEFIQEVQKDAYISGQIDILNQFHLLSEKINNKIYK